MPQELRHAGEGPATAVRVTDERSLALGRKRITPRDYTRELRRRQRGSRRPRLLTCMAPQVDLQTTGFVILFAASREGARKEFLFPEVGPVMGEQSAHCDERLLTA